MSEEYEVRHQQVVRLRNGRGLYVLLREVGHRDAELALTCRMGPKESVGDTLSRILTGIKIVQRDRVH